jgi:hypothetical protein
MFLHVIDAEYLEKYKLKLKFNNDEIKEVDLKDELYGEIFEPLKDIQKFKNFFISQNTIEWDNGADFAPEFLYSLDCNHKI